MASVEEKINISEKMRNLKIGGKAEFPMVKMLSVRVIAYNFGVVMGRTYSAHLDRDRKVIIVTRKK